MAVFMFSLAGIPPTVGFYAKLAVLQALVSTNVPGYIWLAVVAVVLSLIGAFYYLRVVKVMYFDEPVDAHPIDGTRDVRMLLSLNGAAVLSARHAAGRPDAALRAGDRADVRDLSAIAHCPARRRAAWRLAPPSTPTTLAPARDAHRVASRSGAAPSSTCAATASPCPTAARRMREYIVHPGAVMIVPLLDDGRVVVERQWRYPMGRAMLEFPAGKLEPGEPVLDCAVRELIEETGYRAAEWARAGILHNAIGYSDEGIEVWFARGLERRRAPASTPASSSTSSRPSVDELEDAARPRRASPTPRR